ncbi:MAG: hypothetical protein GXP27_15485 [Planctomycetes bacterium]|nr:hypothetical protein [Planctomycetota bacterium]
MNAKGNSSLELSGLNGSNLLAFLAAVGTLRSLSTAWPEEPVRMYWKRKAGWCPVIVTEQPLDEETLVATLHRRLRTMHDHPALAVDDNLKIPPDRFRQYAAEACDQAHRTGDRTWADFVAAFGCDVIAQDKVIQDTAFRTMSGAGHQHFLKTMRELIEVTEPEHLRKALFQPWTYDDGRPSLRWDPEDDRRYALRWNEPSGDPIRTVRGANRLAIEALPLFPTAPVRSSLETTGFRTGGSRDTFFTWPIWSCAIPIDVVRTLLAIKELQQDDPDRRRLLAHGVVEVYRCQRLTIGKYRNFAPARTV